METVKAWVRIIARIVGGGWFTWLFTYYLWKEDLLELWKALRYVTVADVTQALMVCGVIGVVTYVLGRVEGWPRKNFYSLVALPLAKRLRPKLYNRLGDYNRKLDQLDLDDADEDDDEDDDGGEDVLTHPHEVAVHRLTQRVEYWSTRIMNLAFAVLVCIFVNGLLHNVHESALGWVMRLVSVLLFVSLIGIPMQHMVGIAVFAIWLDGVALARGEVRSSVQAALIGVAWVLWTLWEQWQKKIRATPLPPEPDVQE